MVVAPGNHPNPSEEPVMNIATPSHPIEEDELVRQAVAGDLDAFNQLVLRHQAMAYNHAHALLGDPAEADDVTQESFVKAFQALQTFRGGSFRGWLLKIVTNTAYDILRRSQRHPSQPLFPQDDEGDEIESPAWLADPNASVQAAVEQNEESKRLQSMLDEMPDVYRSVITLVDLYELDYTEAAQALKVPIGTVKSRLARARLQMKEKLQNTAYHPANLCSAEACFSM
jgi:RNA polymerase sigma-70 factor (ECF subfamily)